MPVLLSQRSREVIALAVEEATKLGHRTWGSEHVLLAMSRFSGEDARGAEILSELGVTEGRVRELFERHRPPETDFGEAASDEQRRGRCQPPDVPRAADLERVWLHTRWLAAYFGKTRADTVHLLLGTLWDEKADSKVLRQLGVRFEDAYREATGREPPEEIAPPRSVFVSTDDLATLLPKLPETLPPGVSFGFAHDDELAWFSTDSEIDLAEHVRRALASPEDA